MNPNTLITGLTTQQADGLACITCATDYLRVRASRVPVGHSVTGSQVFVCLGCDPTAAQPESVQR